MTNIRYFFSLIGILLLSSLHAQHSVLHYDETTGFNHNTGTQSMALFTALGNEDGYTVTQDSDGSEFTTAKLQNYDVVIFSNTSGNSGLNQAQRDAFEWYIDTHGGSLLGIHAASDTYRHSSANGNRTGTWDWFAETLGGSVQNSPNHTSSSHVALMTDLVSHPSIENITFPWQKQEEYYYWENGYLNNNITELFEVESTGGNSYDEERPMGWIQTKPSGAKIFYTALGHSQSNFTGGFPQFEQLMKDAVLWMLSSDSNPNQPCMAGDEDLIGTECVPSCGGNLAINTACDCIPVTNIALNGIASMSSMFNNTLVAENLNDDIINNSSDQLAHTSGDSTTDWVEIDLGSNHHITAIAIKNRTSCCSERLSNAYVLVSSSPFPSDTDLAAALNTSEFTHQLGDVSGMGHVGVDIYTTGRYVRIQKSGNNDGSHDAINLKELQIFSQDFTFPIVGQSCDDGDSSTTDDTYNSNCICEGTDIVCPDIYMLTETYDTGVIEFYASNYIDISSKILSGANVSVHASNQVEMTIGFEVDLGSIFEAAISGCP